MVVVGAGSAGCVVAARLAESGAPTVLIEAGPAGAGPRTSGAAGLVDPDGDPARYWSPLPVLRDSADSGISAGNGYWMGRGLGGGSAVNGMLVMPGDRADYDRWAGIDGCADWSAETMAPWLTKAAAVLDPEERPVDPETVDLVATFDAAFAELGLDHVGTTLDQDRCGVFTPMLATRGGVRRSVADAYLRTADPNLRIETDQMVGGLVVEGGSVSGVVLADGETVTASTVVLAAGTVGTARLLGETGAVRGVGDWIKNHAAASIPFPWPVDNSSSRPPQVHRVARWRSAISGTGLAPEAVPDLTAILMGPFPTPAGATGLVIVMASTVRSLGRLDFGRQRLGLISSHLAEPDDVARLRSGTRPVLAVCRRLADLAAADRADAARRELDELDHFTDPELDDWLVGHPGPVHHAVGSCRMGTASDGAVTVAKPGRAGTIPGLDGVVVADASLFPDLVAGGLQLPVMAVAERIAAETLLR